MCLDSVKGCQVGHGAAPGTPCGPNGEVGHFIWLFPLLMQPQW